MLMKGQSMKHRLFQAALVLCLTTGLLAGLCFAQPGKHWITAVARSTGAAGQKPFTVRTNWAQRGFTPSGKRFNRFENVLSPATVGTIDLHWSFLTGDWVFISSPAVANGALYVGSWDHNVYALNA
jgi:glucose dehydrogenase